MRQEQGDIWTKHDEGHWIVIPTNGYVALDGHAVMGRGLARMAQDRYPRVAYLLGERIKKLGNHVHILEEQRLISYPVKTHWREAASIALIQRSAWELRMHADLRGQAIFLPRVGCGNGRLVWAIVEPVLGSVLVDPRFVIVWNGEVGTPLGDALSRALDDERGL